MALSVLWLREALKPSADRVAADLRSEIDAARSKEKT